MPPAILALPQWYFQIKCKIFTQKHKQTVTNLDTATRWYFKHCWMYELGELKTCNKRQCFIMRNVVFITPHWDLWICAQMNSRILVFLGFWAYWNITNNKLSSCIWTHCFLSLPLCLSVCHFSKKWVFHFTHSAKSDTISFSFVFVTPLTYSLQLLSFPCTVMWTDWYCSILRNKTLFISLVCGFVIRFLSWQSHDRVSLLGAPDWNISLSSWLFPRLHYLFIFPPAVSPLFWVLIF